MNFIAGFLFLFFKEEALAFAVLRELIHKFNMTKLFNTELPMLKLNFYQLDRLISILLPDLHSHFKVRNLLLTFKGGKCKLIAFQLGVLHNSVYFGDQQPR
jgi:hypothetical protein